MAGTTFNRTRTPRRWLRPAWGLLLGSACAGSAGGGPAAAPAERRAILVSFDALNQDRVRTTVPADSVPAFSALFATASCADGARPMWPSVTAASHAALWTGAYGNVNGVVSNNQAPLPWSEFSLRELRSGFEPRELAAEPIWITAARAGRAAVGHHVTQAGAPGRWLAGGGRDTAAVRRDSVALADSSLFVLNGYNGGAPPRLLTPQSHPPHPAPPWRNQDRLGTTVAPREVSWLLGRDSVHALFYGREAFTEAVVSPLRDVTRGVRVRPIPVEREPVSDRELARHFSDVLWLGSEDGRGGVYFRLWELAPDLSSFQLFHSGRAVMRSNHAEALGAYEEAVGGFVDNPAAVVLRAAGPPIEEGGDGTAELKYLETAELQTRQFIRGSEWLWRTRRPALLADYFSLADGLDHEWLGFVSPAVPGHDPERARRIAAMRIRGFALVDRRLASLVAMARSANALLLVSGDHGMRPTWRNFHVNTVLRRAGLLEPDPQGRPDLSRSRALAPTGYFVQVNRVERKAGIVPPSDAEETAQRAAHALLESRGPDGEPIVTRVWRPAPDDTLGIGGPAGGEVYFDLAPGYYYSPALNNEIVTARPPSGSHGFPSIEPDMRTAFCALGPGVGGRRLPTVRVIDAAPTISAWLGIPAPAESRGTSRLDWLRAP